MVSALALMIIRLPARLKGIVHVAESAVIIGSSSKGELSFFAVVSFASGSCLLLLSSFHFFPAPVHTSMQIHSTNVRVDDKIDDIRFNSNPKLTTHLF